MPLVLIDSVDDYIHNGDLLDHVHQRVTAPVEQSDLNDDELDVKPLALMRLLITLYGDQFTPEADYLISDLIPYETEHKKMKRMTVRSSNAHLVACRVNFVQCLIRAMVWVGIPIMGYFDGKHVLLATD